MPFVITQRAVLSVSKDSRVSKVLRDYSAPKLKFPYRQIKVPTQFVVRVVHLQRSLKSESKGCTSVLPFAEDETAAGNAPLSQQIKVPICA